MLKFQVKRPKIQFESFHAGIILMERATRYEAYILSTYTFHVEIKFLWNIKYLFIQVFKNYNSKISVHFT